MYENGAIDDHNEKERMVNVFLLSQKYKLPKDPLKISGLRKKMENLDSNGINGLLMVHLKNPWLAVLWSFLLGSFAVDRFYVGDVVLGLTKLALGLVWFVAIFFSEIAMLFFLLCQCVWIIVDVFLIYKVCQNKNMEILAKAIIYFERTF